MPIDIIYADLCREVAGKVFENFLKILGKCVIVEETEYLLPDEAERDVETVEMEQSTSLTTSSNEEYMPSESSTVTYNRMSFEIKLKIVMIADEHPNWSFKYLQSRFKQYLYHNSDIAHFKKEIITGGTFNDKMDSIKKMCINDLLKHGIRSS